MVSRGGVGLLDSDSAAGNVRAAFANGVTDHPSVAELYSEHEEAAAYERHAAETAALAVSYDGYDDGGEEGAVGGDGSGGGGAAGAVAGVVLVAMAALVVLSATVYRRGRPGTAGTAECREADVESNWKRPATTPEFVNASMSSLESNDAFGDKPVLKLSSSPELERGTVPPAPAAGEAPARGFAATAYDYETASIRVQSVRRINPAYTQSVVFDADAVRNGLTEI